MLFAASLGISKRDFYTKIGVSRGTLESKTGITEDVITKFFATYPEVSIEWLMTGRGDMRKTLTIDPQSSTPTKPTISIKPNIGTPYFDVDFIGGFTEIFNDQTIIPTCNILVPGFEKASIWCNVTGHSMEPKINPGDIIALHECTINDIQFGEIYAVVLDTIRTIKIIRKGSTPDKLLYVPINEPAYEEREFEISRIIRIFEVIGSISKFF